MLIKNFISNLTVYGDDVLEPYLYKNETDCAPLTFTETNMSATLGRGIGTTIKFTGPYLHNPGPPDGLRTVGPALEVVLSASTANILYRMLLSEPPDLSNTLGMDPAGQLNCVVVVGVVPVTINHFVHLAPI